MKEVKEGDTVKVHYTGKLQDGTVFDNSRNREPLQFKVGAGQMIKGFERAVIGMKEGEQKEEEISSINAYGDRRQDLVVEVAKERFPDDIEPEVGKKLSIKNEKGVTVPVIITEDKGEQVVLDANHPLAGQDLIFDIEIVEIA